MTEAQLKNVNASTTPSQSTRTDFGRYWLAFGLVFSGVVLLLINFGYLSIGYLLTLSQLWPVFLVLLGLDLVFRRHLLLRWMLLMVGMFFFIGTIFWSALLLNPACGMMLWHCF